MIILLDIDGVLVTTPAWRQVDLLPDGFMKFDDTAVENLAILLKETKASVVLTTTHRVNFTIAKWKELFKTRGLIIQEIAKLNDKTELSHLQGRGTEIKEWFAIEGKGKNFVIIDDDQSINELSEFIKNRWVQTKPLIGFNEEARLKASHILFS